MINEVLILAGGLGTRLQEVIPNFPKCMAAVNGKPFLAYVIDHFLKQGVKKFIFSLGYKHHIIEEFIKTQFSTINFQFSIEGEPLGTGGAIKLACLKATEKNVLVVNGDTLFEINVNKLAKFHQINDADCTLSLKSMQKFNRYGEVGINNNYTIRYFNEKQFCKSGLINGGVYALHAIRFLQENFPDIFSFEKDYLEKFINNRRIYGFVQNEYFIDIGIPDDYRKAQTELKMI